MNTYPVLIIPVYNPTKRLVTLVQQLTDLLSNSLIILVNDGSPKTSTEIFEQLKQTFNVTLLNHSCNLGKGQALKTAFNYCLEKKISTQGMITMDADGQHLIDDIVNLYDKFINDPQALWIGTRSFPKSTPWRSRFGNNVTAFIFKKLLQTSIKDTQSGLRAIPLDLIPKLVQLKTTGFEFELEMLIATIENHVEIKTIPIKTVYIDKNKHSNFNPILDSIKVYQVLFSYFIKKYTTIFYE